MKVEMVHYQKFPKLLVQKSFGSIYVCILWVILLCCYVLVVVVVVVVVAAAAAAAVVVLILVVVDGGDSFVFSLFRG